MGQAGSNKYGFEFGYRPDRSGLGPLREMLVRLVPAIGPRPKATE